MHLKSLLSTARATRARLCPCVRVCVDGTNAAIVILKGMAGRDEGSLLRNASVTTSWLRCARESNSGLGNVILI